MKLLILGNHTCGNRGDSAILRGLLDAINILNPHAEVDVMSRYPVSSSWLLNRPVMGDPLFLQMKKHNSAAGVVGRVKKVLRRRYQHQVLLSRVTDTGKLRNIAIAQGFTDFVRLLSGYDAIIQVGGSFFVDLYGVPQFEHALCTFMAKKPLFMIGHSVGPFQDEQFNQLANYVFGHCDALILRESVSLELMKRSNITTAKVEHGVDTAWLVDHHTEDFTASYAVQHWLDVAAQQKTVAITLRELAPFDKRLGTTQQAYEKAFAGVVNRILDEGYQVIALSTCTGIDSYNKDDRMVALKLRGISGEMLKTAWRGNFRRLLALNRDIMLRSLLLQLCFGAITVLGARLGSDIIAVNAVLMTLLTFTAYALDGFAYAVEAHSGQAYGARDGSQLLDVWRAACRQSGIVALLFSVVYLLAGEHIIALLTSLTQIQQLADRYLIWQVILPLVGVWCYLLDGMFIGATRAAEMRNSMAVAAAGFALTLLTLPWLGNHGLWLALTVFLALRGLSLAAIWRRHWRNGTWFAAT